MWYSYLRRLNSQCWIFWIYASRQGRFIFTQKILLDLLSYLIYHVTTKTQHFISTSTKQILTFSNNQYFGLTWKQVYWAKGLVKTKQNRRKQLTHSSGVRLQRAENVQVFISAEDYKTGCSCKYSDLLKSGVTKKQKMEKRSFSLSCLNHSRSPSPEKTAH